MRYQIEIDREEDGRWIAEVPELPGVLAYGASKGSALAHVKALSLRVLAERLEEENSGDGLDSLSFATSG